MGVGVRLGLSGRWLLAQATLDGWTPPFTPAPSFGQPSSGHLEMLVAGVDLGGVLRLPRRFELRGGAGWRLVRATASMGYAIATPIGGGVASEMTITHSRSVASVFGSVLYAPAEERWHLRGRVGLEIRRDLGGAIRFDAFGRDVAPGTAVLLLLGGELRLGPARTVATSGP